MKQWPHLMQSESVTQVYICHGMRDSLEVGYVKEFMSALQQLCASHSCALSISTQQRQDGLVENTIHTLLLLDVVSALIAKHKLNASACTALAELVPLQALTSINVVMEQVRNLRVNHGH